MAAGGAAFQLEALEVLGGSRGAAAASSGGGGGRGPAAPLYHLCFRPAATHSVDEHCIDATIPSWVPWGEVGSLQQQQLFFVSLQPAAQPAGSSQDIQLGRGGVAASRVGGGGGHTSPAVSLSHGCSEVSWPAVALGAPTAPTPPAAAAAGAGGDGGGGSSVIGSDPIEGLCLGQLMGRGSQGSVYQGWLHGELVAVKIAGDANASPLEWEALLHEAQLGRRLSHPFLVTTRAAAVVPQGAGPLGLQRLSEGAPGEEGEGAGLEEGQSGSRRDGGYFYPAARDVLGAASSTATASAEGFASSTAAGGSGSGEGLTPRRVLLPLGPWAAAPGSSAAVSGAAGGSQPIVEEEDEEGSMNSDEVALLTQEADALYPPSKHAAAVAAGAGGSADPGDHSQEGLLEATSPAAAQLVPGSDALTPSGTPPAAHASSSAGDSSYTPASSLRAGLRGVPHVPLQPAHRAAAASAAKALEAAAPAAVAHSAASASGSACALQAGGGGSTPLSLSDASCVEGRGRRQEGQGSGVCTSGGPGAGAGAGAGGGVGVGGPREALCVWSVMEYCDKGCLQDALDLGWLREATCLSSPVRLEAVLVTAQEVAEGLGALHAAGVVHGDLTSYNVLLTSQGRWAARAGRGWYAKIADFGYSRALAGAEVLRVNAYGSITHMAPEVLQHKLVSRPADVYALGVLLWQLITCSRPWAGLRSMEVVEAVAVRRLALKLPPDTPPAYREVTLWCMHPEPSQRPPISTVVERLQAMRSDRVRVEDF